MPMVVPAAWPWNPIGCVYILGFIPAALALVSACFKIVFPDLPIANSLVKKS